MRRTYRTLNDYEMQHNAEVGLFTGPSTLNPWARPCFPLPLRRNSWRRIQCDRFKNAYRVASPDRVPISGRGGQA